jgi:hypothetical protein
MTNTELIDILSKFPGDSHVNFCVFSNLTPRRCDIHDNHIMIKRSPHTGELNVMLDLEGHWERDLIGRLKSESET